MSFRPRFHRSWPLEFIDFHSIKSAFKNFCQPINSECLFSPFSRQSNAKSCRSSPYVLYSHPTPLWCFRSRGFRSRGSPSNFNNKLTAQNRGIALAYNCVILASKSHNPHNSDERAAMIDVKDHSRLSTFFQSKAYDFRLVNNCDSAPSCTCLLYTSPSPRD